MGIQDQVRHRHLGMVAQGGLVPDDQGDHFPGVEEPRELGEPGELSAVARQRLGAWRLSETFSAHASGLLPARAPHAG